MLTSIQQFRRTAPELFKRKYRDVSTKPKERMVEGPCMTRSTLEDVLSWDHYPENAPMASTYILLNKPPKIPDFSVLHFQNGIRCFPCYGETIWTHKEPCPGAGYCDANHYGERPQVPNSTVLTTKYWETATSRSAREQRERYLKEKDARAVKAIVEPSIPRACSMCREMMPEKKCALPEQNMGSLCAVHEKHKGKILMPADREKKSYWDSLTKRLDDFERRNRTPKIWVKSGLPTFNRNDGELDVKKSLEEGYRVYKDNDPRMVPEIALSHGRTEDSSGYDECAFPDDWKEAPATSEKDDYIYTESEPEVKSQGFTMPKPIWVHLTRTNYDKRHQIYIGMKTYFKDEVRKEIRRVWKLNDRKDMLVWRTEAGRFVKESRPTAKALTTAKVFMLTVEEKTVTVRVRHDVVITKAIEYPTLININTGAVFEKNIKARAKVTGQDKDELRAKGSITISSTTIVTRKDRAFFRKKREEEKMKKMGYMNLDNNPRNKPFLRNGVPVSSKELAALTVEA